MRILRGPLYLSLFILVVIATISQSCSSGSETREEPSSNAEPSPEPESGPVCRLDKEYLLFHCDMKYSILPGSSCRDAGPAVRQEFLSRMTRISLESLYLDGEPGAQSPYSYNNPGQVLKEIAIRDCVQENQVCQCRFEYGDSHLLEIFYDSAGCRAGSAFRNQPLYFRGRGCRR